MNRQASWRGLGPILFALLYGASPIDLIPDLIPVLGLLDDALIVPTFLMLGLFQLHKSRRLATAKSPRIIPPR